MGIIKNIINMIRSNYHLCKLCNEENRVVCSGYIPYKMYENIFSDATGNILLKCPACKGTGIIWG